MKETPKKSDTPAPPAVAQKNIPVLNWQSSLFPEGHGNYTLPLQNDAEEVFEDTCTCPICKEAFPLLYVIATKLRPDGTDSDMRVRYKGIDPMYYEIITCPSCLYSAAEEQFKMVTSRLAGRVKQELAIFLPDTPIKTGKDRDSFTVIAGYYLAILCAHFCFDEHEMSTARHWQKLSRIYQDCEDQNMYLHASKNALEQFRLAYDHYDYTPKQMQQLCFIIGDLYQKLGDLETARRYFYDTKMIRDGSSVMRNSADLRMDEIKKLLKAPEEK